jgi:lipopolysaccharide export system permease protein
VWHTGQAGVCYALHTRPPASDGKDRPHESPVLMSLIERYVLRRASRIFFLSLCAVIGTLWVTQVLRLLDVVTAKGQAIWTFVMMTIVALPALVQVVAPISFLTGAILTLNSMTHDSELPVIAAAGASRSTINRPILVLAIFITVALSFSYHVVAPASLAVLRELVTHVRADVIAALVQDGGFRSVDQGLTMHIREKAPDGSFRDIFVDDARNPNEALQYSAAHGFLLDRAGGSYLVLQSGDMIRQDLTTGETNVVDFETYALDLSQLGSPDATAIYKARERSTLYLLEPDSEDTSLNFRPARVAFELHDRIVSPLYTIVFAVLTLAFLGRPRTNRQDRSFAIATVVILCMLLRTGGFVAAAISSNIPAAIPLLYVIPALGFVFGLGAMIFDARLPIPAFVETMWDRLSTTSRPRLASAGDGGTA